jgi:hypothetical protein
MSVARNCVIVPSISRLWTKAPVPKVVASCKSTKVGGQRGRAGDNPGLNARYLDIGWLERAVADDGQAQPDRLDRMRGQKVKKLGRAGAVGRLPFRRAEGGAAGFGAHGADVVGAELDDHEIRRHALAQPVLPAGRPSRRAG